MRKPIVALVGRPNVGKSTLFNKIAGQRISIVQDTPGVTRDRVYADAEWLNYSFTMIDTGGIEPERDDIIVKQMRRQAQIAIETADVIIFLVDGKEGITSADEDVANMLRKSKKPVVLAVNKIDSLKEEKAFLAQHNAQLKKELEEMGMFAAEYKQPIPQYAGRIGVVTAPTGAAVQDIRNVSSRRNPYVQVILYPALVQGEGAADSIVKGIQTLDAMNLDVIIVGRGGGYIEDLWAFNEEIVARAIFDCRTPIISAVGHETDWTIADFVSDRRAPTPSAAAELAVSDYRQTLERLDNLRRRMDRNLTGRIDFFREKLSHIKTRLNFLSPQNKLNENKRRLADIEDALERIMKQRLSDCRQRLALLSGTLDAYSPAKKLAHGYAYVEVEKKGALHSVSDINAGDDINIYLIDGHARAVVSEVINDEQRK